MPAHSKSEVGFITYNKYGKTSYISCGRLMKRVSLVY